MELYERIKLIRKSKGVSQSYVAIIVGLSISNYNMKENGKRTISAKELEAIADALREPIGNFFDELIHVKLNCDSTIISQPKEVYLSPLEGKKIQKEIS